MNFISYPVVGYKKNIDMLGHMTDDDPRLDSGWGGLGTSSYLW